MPGFGAEPGEQVITDFGVATTVPLDSTATCAWCKKTYSPHAHPFGLEITGQCGICTASGYLENEHNDEAHEADKPGAGCAECSEELVLLAEVA